MILLPEDRYPFLKEKIKEVKKNNLFARSVIERHVTGKIYADNINNPETFYVIHPYGITLLFGASNNVTFNKWLKAYAMNTEEHRHCFEWMQTWPGDWDIVLSDLFGDQLIRYSDNSNHVTEGIIELNTRVNFKFNEKLYSQRRRKQSGNEVSIEETNQSHFELMSGSVIPMKFWDSAADFLRMGKGYTLLHHGKIASTAYSAFVHDEMLEIGIETMNEYRGLGYAEMVCSRLIDYCMEKNLTPVWSCRFENTASLKLAQKLGFEISGLFPFYRLSQ